MSNNPKRVEGARTKASTAGSVGTVANIKIGGEWKFQKKPAYIKDRMAVWEELYAVQLKNYESKLIIIKTREILNFQYRFTKRGHQDHNA